MCSSMEHGWIMGKLHGGGNHRARTDTTMGTGKLIGWVDWAGITALGLGSN